MYNLQNSLLIVLILSVLGFCYLGIFRVPFKEAIKAVLVNDVLWIVFLLSVFSFLR